ncbi:uncharacterized protein PHACADRAFT_249349 [Phanerochaete carnosa HHB-10118-sp]|uniref:Uncharacterized protein n=1 Tax=Phanerochaete carnosa (strain HHB-10118-sp) TaxID=650164 RepID=K5V8H5_PHACS|nr:uncharacterized protein PHACADRAFT_249349 [Phanerochaete carnosa HHB-10118-sp]EKM59116.1 hypothetical protein PHACADRAFT_249349 [Phanerochaete carnosa HHB-10118-sp]
MAARCDGDDGSRTSCTERLLGLRSISLCASLASAVLNSFCALRILLSWRSLRWDFSGVDDTDSFPVNVDALHLLWGLFTLYFAAAATASTIGFVGIARNSISYVRFFRDYSVADLLFMIFSSLTISYLSFSSASSLIRTSVCEELGRQPDLLRDIAESGLDLENCEYWFERGIVVVIAMLFVLVIVRVHFVLALSKYYGQLRRVQAGFPSWYLPLSSSARDLEMATQLQHIYLLPTTTSPEYTSLDAKEKVKASDLDYEDRGSEDETEDDGVMLYTPVPLGRVSREEAKGMGVREAWMEAPSTSTTPTHSKKHRRHHSYSQARPSSKAKTHRHHRSVDATQGMGGRSSSRL